MEENKIYYEVEKIIEHYHDEKLEYYDSDLLIYFDELKKIKKELTYENNL